MWQAWLIGACVLILLPVGFGLAVNLGSGKRDNGASPVVGKSGKRCP